MYRDRNESLEHETDRKTTLRKLTDLVVVEGTQTNVYNAVFTNIWVYGVESLTKLLHGTAALASFCLTNKPAGTLNCHQPLMQAHAWSHRQKTSPVVLVINSLPCLPVPICLIRPLDKTPPQN